MHTGISKQSVLTAVREGMLNTARSAAIHLPYFVILVVANFFIYRDYWLGRKIITSKDFLTAFYPLLNFQSDCLQGLSWPLWNPFMNFGYPFVEHYINTSLFPTHLVMGLITGSNLTIIHWELLSWIIVGGFGIYLCVREFGHSPLTAMICGVSFMFCGQMLSLPQWSLIVYNAASFPYLVLGYHRSVRSKNFFSLLSIGFLAMTILGGYLSTLVYGMYIFAGYVIIDSVLQKDLRHGIKYLVCTVASAVLIALPKIVPLFNAMQAGPRIGSYTPTPDPFNTVNFHNFPSLLLPVKFYFSLYIGELFIIALCYGLLRKQRTVNALLILALLTGWLFMVDGEGNVSLLRSLSYVLPLMKVARNEWLNWYYPSIFAILYLARYVDEFLSEGNRKTLIGATVLFIAILSALFVTEYSMSLHMQAYLVHAGLALAWLAAAFMKDRRRIQTALAIVLVTAEFMFVVNRVSVDMPPLRHGDRVQVVITHQVNASQSFSDDERVHQTFTGLFSDDRHRPAIDQARNNPFLISGLGGAPGYNMFPQQYTLFIDAMNFKKFSGWWHNTQERNEFERVKDSPLLAAMDNRPLFEYFSRRTGEPINNAVSFDGLSCSQFSFTVDGGESGFLLLNQMFDDRWKVRVDGREQPLHRANDFFMGTEVGAGRHAVMFVFRDNAFLVCLLISISTLMALVALRMRMSLKGR